MRRADFIATARSYIGTPFHHQGRVPGTGLDCVGLVVCAARAQGLVISDVAGYAHTPSGAMLVGAISEHCDFIQQAVVLPGDLMLFAFDSDPQHIAVISQISPDGTITLLHSYAQVRRVVENHFDLMWKIRLRGCYRIRGIE